MLLVVASQSRKYCYRRLVRRCQCTSKSAASCTCIAQKSGSESEFLRALLCIFYQWNIILIMRRLKPAKNQPTQHSDQEEHSIEALHQLVISFDEIYKYKHWMVRLGDAGERMDGRLIGETYIISGPAQSGKASLLYWALRNDERVQIVSVDCALHRTEMQFIQKLTREIGEQIGLKGLDKKAIIQENIKFSELNGAIKESDTPIVILIRNAERLVEYRKQILLYNILEWVATDIKKYVGLVFTTRLIYFVDRFEKRVRSRLAARTIALGRPSPENLIILLARRIETAIEAGRESLTPRTLEILENVGEIVGGSKKLLETIRDLQERCHRDIVCYLNAMKLVFSSFDHDDHIYRMDRRRLELELCQKLKNSCEAIFPSISKYLLQTCSYPEYLVMAIVHYMGVHQRTPYRFKTVYEVYLQFKQKFITSSGSGSSFAYSKGVMEKAVMKLEEVKLIELQNKEESIWSCDIRVSIYPDEIKSALEKVEDLPYFITEILKS